MQHAKAISINNGQWMQAHSGACQYAIVQLSFEASNCCLDTRLNQADHLLAKKDTKELLVKKGTKEQEEQEKKVLSRQG